MGPFPGQEKLSKKQKAEFDLLTDDTAKADFIAKSIGENKAALSGGIAGAAGVGSAVIGALDTDPGIGAADYAKNGLSMAATGATIGGPVGAGIGLAVGIGTTALQASNQDKIEKEKQSAQGLAIGQSRAAMQYAADGGVISDSAIAAPVKIKETDVYNPYSLKSDLLNHQLRKPVPMPVIEAGKQAVNPPAMFKGGTVVSPNVPKGKQAVNRQGLNVGGPVEGEGTGTSDDIELKLNVGDFVVPEMNASIAQTLRDTYLSKGDEINEGDKKGTRPVALSNGEHVFTKAEADVLKSNGINLEMLAPNAEKTGYGFYKGGKIGGKEVQYLKDGNEVKGGGARDKWSEKIEDLYNNVNVKAYLNGIMHGETSPTDAASGKNPESSATGYFQFLKGTNKYIKEKYGYEGQNKEISESAKAAIALIIDNKALDSIINGDFDAADKRLKTIWTSLPGGKEANSKTDSIPLVRKEYVENKGQVKSVKDAKVYLSYDGKSDYKSTTTKKSLEEPKRETFDDIKGIDLDGIRKKIKDDEAKSKLSKVEKEQAPVLKNDSTNSAAASYSKDPMNRNRFIETPDEELAVSGASTNTKAEPSKKADNKLKLTNKEVEDRAWDYAFNDEEMKVDDLSPEDAKRVEDYYFKSVYLDGNVRNPELFNKKKEEYSKQNLKKAEEYSADQSATLENLKKQVKELHESDGIDIDWEKGEIINPFARSKEDNPKLEKLYADFEAFKKQNPKATTDQNGKVTGLSDVPDSGVRWTKAENKGFNKKIDKPFAKDPMLGVVGATIDANKNDMDALLDKGATERREAQQALPVPEKAASGIQGLIDRQSKPEQKIAQKMSNNPMFGDHPSDGNMNEDPEVSLFSKLGGYGGLLAVAQTGMGLAGLATNKDPGTYAGDPNLSTRLGEAQIDATRLNPAIRANAESGLELTRRTRNAETARMSAGDVGLAMSASRESAIDKNRGIMGLAALEEQTQGEKNARVDARTDALSQDKMRVYDSKNQRFMLNQQAAAGLLNTGINNFIGATNYSKYMNDLTAATKDNGLLSFANGMYDMSGQLKKD